MDYTSSGKEKKIIIENGFKFCFYKMLKYNIQRWKYFLSTCKCFLKVSPTLIILERCNKHNPEKCGKHIQDKPTLSNSNKRKAPVDIFTWPSKLIRSEKTYFNIPTIDRNDLKLIRNIIHHDRRLLYLKLLKHT